MNSHEFTNIVCEINVPEALNIYYKLSKHLTNKEVISVTIVFVVYICYNFCMWDKLVTSMYVSV